jgi:AcrR family transcriptional regulator
MPEVEAGATAAGRGADQGAERSGDAAGVGSRTPERRRRARRGEGERLRAEIVDAACRMLAETGAVGELSLRAVARAVGVATTSIYLHFERIDELVLAVKRRYFEEFGEALDVAAGQAGEAPLARARARAHRYVGYGLANRGRYWVMFSSETLPSHLTPGRGYIGAEVFETVRDEIAAAVGPDVDADLLAIHFWTAMHGIVMLRTARRNFPWPDLDHQIDHFIERILGPA